MRLSNWESSPIKKRRLWWTDPGFFWFVGVVYLGTGAVGIYWISFRADIAAQIMIAFWLFMLPVIIWLYKRTLFEHYYSDESIVDKTRRDLSAHRVKVRNEFVNNEIELLKKGEKTPVLDIWRLDPELQKRHSFFSCIDIVSVDPTARELQVRLQIEQPPESSDRDHHKRSIFLTNVMEFLTVISRDMYLANLRQFFHSIILEIYAMRENEKHVDVSFPVFSIHISAQNLWKLSTVQTNVRNPSLIGDVHFSNGNEIKPHRSIESPKLSSK